ncbi:hypothetical protein ACQ4PT_068312 [Festuca glaucescens]
MSSPAWIWNVSYSSVDDLDSGVRNLLDGELHIWPAKRWIALVDVEGTPIIGKFMRKEDDALEVGSVVEFSVFHALVDHCILSPPEDNGSGDDLMIDKSSAQDLTNLVKFWKISYSTVKDLDRGRMKAYDGSLSLSTDNFLRLFNAKSAPIGCQRLSSRDLFHVGAKIHFSEHVVRMGKLIKSSPAVDVIMSEGISNDVHPSPAPVKAAVVPLFTHQANGAATVKDTPTSASSVHATLFKGLDFSHGINFAKDVKYKFNKEVHPIASSGNFIMVVSFGRASFKLEEDLVGISLEAVIGGFCGQLKVSMIRDRVFSFCVSCKEVGFHILKLRKFSCTQFKCCFHLWGRGGPNWRWEFQRWQRESEEEWTLVSPSKRILQHGLAALKKHKPKSILGKTIGTSKTLSFAPSMDYEACLGYQDPKVAMPKEGAPLEKFVTNNAPIISFAPVNPFPFKQHKLVEGETSAANDNLSDVASPSNEVEEMDDFDSMIDDMAYKVWSCGHCLSMGHNTKDCTNEVRCRSCFSYGHIRRNCLSAKSKGKVWVPKKTQSNTASRIIPDKEVHVSRVAGSASTPFNIPLDSLQKPQGHIKSTSPPVSAAPSSSQAMAVFEVDPTPWLPWGHEIIDGGPTRLPRTHYYPSQDPPSRHLAYCIALVEPTPLPAAMALWREQVRDFLIGPLQRNVVTSQPSLFGVGLYQMSSPNSVNALVQHGQYQIQNRLLRFVHVGEAPQNHRATLGFRRGWLMMLGVHPDYRNDYDIAHAVATFGQFHTWNSNDPVKDRVLVYASFPSPQWVPRDVVFNKFATVGGVKESWTAPVYILSADFADALPADEDQMPPDGNPHPFPGELQQNNNVFVNPQFPEIGWDAVDNLGQDMQGDQAGDHGQPGGWQQMEQVQEVQGVQGLLQEMQESMVINLSDSSSSSVNMMDVQPQQQQGNLQVLYNELNVGMVHTVFGPTLPPEMLCDRAFQLVLPSLCSRSVPGVMRTDPFVFLGKLSGVVLTVTGLQKGDKLFFHSQPNQCRGMICPYEGEERMVEEEEEQTSMLVQLPVVSMSALGKIKRKRKSVTPLVQSSERRFTRSCLKSDGYRPAPILAVQPKIKKKTRARNLLLPEEEKAQQEKEQENQDNEGQAQVPAIPIEVLQRVGHALGIAPDKLSKEQLEAAPGEQKKGKSADE